ncbi:hypothetical protein AEA09_09185 [Lysinibacillus contaminans]|uniref:Uncharacterized protein n=1 Tax=Lysinibacillus contaminans TaxID=1293441 RepID=A0ABR5K1U9_9BACI|nr:hypothetical protein [Lysinibacillus contaminans]KOS68697.1 hypothetical protein AEA09_09185 [Lysinibacillus contaminans]
MKYKNAPDYRSKKYNIGSKINPNRNSTGIEETIKAKILNFPFWLKNAVKNEAIIKEMTTMSPISEVPFTTIGEIKAKIINKENNNNEIMLKYLLNTITPPLPTFSIIDYIYQKGFFLVLLNCAASTRSDSSN